MTTGNCYAPKLLLYCNGLQTVDCGQDGTGLWTLVDSPSQDKYYRSFWGSSDHQNCTETLDRLFGQPIYVDEPFQ